MAWFQAYNYYKENAESGELNSCELDNVKENEEYFKVRSSEVEIIGKYLVASNKEAGEFMTTTDILQYLQECVGLSIKLNKIALGKALKEAGFERLISRS